MADAREEGDTGEVKGSGEGSGGEAGAKPKMRHAYTVALIAGINADLADLKEFVASGGLAGFQALDAAQIAAAPEDEILAEQAAQLEEGAAVPPELLAAQFRNVVSRLPPEEQPPQSAESDDPADRLMCVADGPRLFHLCFEFPRDMAVAEAIMEFPGLLDAVVLLSPCPPPSQDSEANGTAESEEPQSEPTEEEKAALAEARAAGQRRELFFRDLQRVAQEQRQGGNNLANCIFTTAVLGSDPRASLSAIGRALLTPVRARLEYMAWRAGLKFVSTSPGTVDLRHYFQSLSGVPSSCTSVAIILNALLEQVALQNCEQQLAPVDDASLEAEARAVRVRMLEALDLGVHNLAAPIAPPQERPQPGRPGIPIFLAEDVQLQLQRLSEPGQDAAAVEALTHAEEKVTHTLPLAAILPEVHPPAPSIDERSVGLEATELLPVAPANMTLDEVKRALVIVEFEDMTGFTSGPDGLPSDVDGWRAAEVSLEPFKYREEHGNGAMTEVLMEATRPSLGSGPTVLSRYYPREDLVLVAVCNEVPFTRTAQFDIRSTIAGFTGFAQWLAARFANKQRRESEEAAERAAAEVAAEKEREIGIGMAPADEADTETPETSETLGNGARPASAPLPGEKPGVSVFYEMDAERAALFDRGQTAFLGSGEQINIGETSRGKYVSLNARSHRLHLREDRSEGASNSCYLASLSFADGAIAFARRQTADAGSAPQQAGAAPALQGPQGLTVVSLGLRDGLLITVRSDGMVWQSRPLPRSRSQLDWKSFTNKTDTAAKPRGQLTLHGDVSQCVSSDADVKSTAVLKDGSVVLWRQDGDCDLLMTDGSCATSLGPGCGFLWTNTRGQRQIRGVPGAAGPLAAPPVAVRREVVYQSGDVVTSRSDRVMTVQRLDGTLIVQHADRTQMVTYPASENRAGVEIHVGVIRMGLVKLGPGDSERTVKAEDGSVISITGHVMELRRPDGSVLQVNTKGGKVVFYTNGIPVKEQPPAESKRGAVAAAVTAAGGGDGPDSGKKGQSKAPSAAGGEEDDEGKSVRSARSGRSGRTGRGGEGPPEGLGPGVYGMSLVTGSFLTEDYTGNVFSLSGKGEMKNSIAGVARLKQRNADNISAADAARNKMAQESGGMDDLRPPSPVVELPPGPRLEPVRLFCLRRDGTGYELVHTRVAERRLQQARKVGSAVVEEHFGTATTFTALRPDRRQEPPAAIADALIPAALRPGGLNPPSAGPRRIAFSALRLTLLPPTTPQRMAQLRTLVSRHQQWRGEEEQQANALYVEDTRAAEGVELERNIQERIAKARKDVGHPPARPVARSSPRAAAVTTPHPPNDPRAAPVPGTGGSHVRGGSRIRAGQTIPPVPPSVPDATSHSSRVTRVEGVGVVFACMPGVADFGAVRARLVYRLELQLLNTSVDYAKFRLRQPKASNLSVIYDPAQVAAGMSVTLTVEVRARGVGDINDELYVLSEVDSFPVPIRATVLGDGAGDPRLPEDTCSSNPAVQVSGQIERAFTLSRARAEQGATSGGLSHGSQPLEGLLSGVTLGELQKTGRALRVAEAEQEQRRVDPNASEGPNKLQTVMGKVSSVSVLRSLTGYGIIRPGTKKSGV